MRLLLDTHTLIWWATDDSALTSRARDRIAGSEEVLVSAATAWEMAIKVSVDKLRVAGPIEQFVPEQLSANGFGLLGIEFAHVARVERLALPGIPRHGAASGFRVGTGTRKATQRSRGRNEQAKS